MMIWVTPVPFLIQHQYQYQYTYCTIKSHQHQLQCTSTRTRTTTTTTTSIHNHNYTQPINQSINHHKKKDSKSILRERRIGTCDSKIKILDSNWTLPPSFFACCSSPDIETLPHHQQQQHHHHPIKKGNGTPHYLSNFCCFSQKNLTHTHSFLFLISLHFFSVLRIHLIHNIFGIIINTIRYDTTQHNTTRYNTPSYHTYRTYSQKYTGKKD